MQTDPRLEAATAVVAEQAWLLGEDGAGLCLVTTALLGHHMHARHGVRVEAVRGTFAGEPHWWCEHEGTVYDPTVTQFGDHETIRPASDPAYQEQGRWPAGWDTEELVCAEARRAFVFEAAADGFVRTTLAALAWLD